MNERIRWVRNNLKSQNMQGMIISNPINVKYLTNIDAEGILLLTLRENIYLTDDRYIENVRRTLTVEDDIVVTNVKDISLEDYENYFMFCENVGFEENYVTYAKYKEFMRKYKIHNLVETEDIIEKQRQIKDEEEISYAKKACEITDKCFLHLLEYIKIGMTEKEVAYEIEKYFKENGADGTSFETIVASGKNSSVPHAVPTDKKIEKEDVIVIDMGCKYKGYCSDMTRTIFAGNIPEYVKDVYDLVLKNQELALSEIKEGASVKIISKMVECNFKLYDYELVHALGHGVGLEIHENPILSPRSEKNLKAGMIITDEPGIYLPGKFGIRIEDTLLVTEDGYELLTNSNKNYCIVG